MHLPNECATRNPRRRWQFSLRTALVVMLVVGAGLGLWVRHERLRRNRLALIKKHETTFERFALEAPFRDQGGVQLHVFVFVDDWTAATQPGADASKVIITNDHFREVAHVAVKGTPDARLEDDRPILIFDQELNHKFTQRTRYLLGAKGISILDTEVLRLGRPFKPRP